MFLNMFFTDKVCSISTHFQILQSLRACHFCQMVNQKDIIGDLCWLMLVVYRKVKVMSLSSATILK
jgi:hypothetical protein